MKPSKKSVIAATRKIARPAYSRPENLVRRTTTRNGTRKMRKSVSEFGRFQISFDSYSRRTRIRLG